MRLPPNDTTRVAQHHQGMGTLRTIAETAWRESWNRALWPSLALSVAVALDQCTRGPSLTAMLITAYLNGALPALS
jgi:hypothetical protein